VCLACGQKTILDPEVEFDTVATEPAAAAGGENGRLGDLVKPEHARVERAQGRFCAGRAGKLDMMDHEPSSPVGNCLDIKLTA
jgi:hypothetical protein